MKRAVLAMFVALAACGPSSQVEAPKPSDPGGMPGLPKALPEERHLRDLRQLTRGGENAEAYWSFDGKQLTLQSRAGDADCDRIYRMPLGLERASDALPPLVPVSSGKGATTCSYFMPGDQQIIYASTHLGGDACPPKPDHSLGYVWALYEDYDIFKADADGKNVTRLTDTKGYDAEGTVCAKDGSIVFTSVRDGDIDLYRMDADGKNVTRLTATAGYDGGAFFNADCSKIVWRASRPHGKDLEDYQKLLAQNQVRPSKLELYVANADGSDATQITYLDAASFAPFWHPSQKRILFSSNHGDPKGREFDIWGIDTDGTHLERITYAPGFDGFPMFSPDGKTLAFSSNRATAKGRHDTNLFVARWIEDARGPTEELAADRVMRDISWLADPAREGRGIGQQGLEQSGAWIESRFKTLGLAPAGDAAGYRQGFPVVTSVKAEDATSVSIDGKALAKGDYVALGYSPAKADVTGELAFAGYGIVAKELAVDDYDKVDVKKKIVVVRRFAPEGGKLESTEAQRRYGDLRRKAFAAREKGAAALLVIDEPAPPAGAKPDWKAPDEAKLPPLVPEGYADAGLPVVVLKRSAGNALIARLLAKTKVTASVRVELTPVSQNAFNVLGRVIAEPVEGKKLPGVVVVGAHYDHLGRGGRYSLAPASEEPHVGADDNASGVSVLLEVARETALRKNQLKRDVVFVAFSGEESGVLGSAHLVHQWTAKTKGKLEEVVAMLNMDMVGRMRENRLQVLGSETASEWDEIVHKACHGSRVECATSGDGYGPSDHSSFYGAGVPVLHFFTGAHADYHKPSDTPDKINAAASRSPSPGATSPSRSRPASRAAPIAVTFAASTRRSAPSPTTADRAPARRAFSSPAYDPEAPPRRPA
jgi:Tol biopolymer transport system component